MNVKKWAKMIAFMMVVVLALAACEQAGGDSALVITDASGAGYASYTVTVRKPGTINVDGDVCENDIYMPGGIDAIYNGIVNATLLPDAEISLGDAADSEYWEIVISFSFDSIDDYNNKLSGLIDGARVYEAELTVDGNEVNFYEDMDNFFNIFNAYAEVIFNDPEAYDPTGGDPGKPESDWMTTEWMAQARMRTVTIGGETVSRDFATAPGDIEFTAVFEGQADEPDEATDTATEEEPAAATEEEPAAVTEEAPPVVDAGTTSPDTGVQSHIILALILLAGALVAAVFMKKARKVKI